MDSLENGPRQTSSVLDVVAQVVNAIRDGQLAPGQRLVETEFAKRLGVARTTIREDFQRLEVDGLLSQERHRGFLVRVIDRSELRQIYEAKGALDGLAARLAAPKFAHDSRKLEELYQGLEDARARHSMKDFTGLNHEFHDLVRRTSENSVIYRMLGTLEQSAYHYQFRLLIDNAQVFLSQDDHARIFQALKNGDADGAEREAREHAYSSLTQLLQLPDTLFGAP